MASDDFADFLFKRRTPFWRFNDSTQFDSVEVKDDHKWNLFNIEHYDLKLGDLFFVFVVS